MFALPLPKELFLFRPTDRDLPRDISFQDKSGHTRVERGLFETKPLDVKRQIILHYVQRNGEHKKECASKAKETKHELGSAINMLKWIEDNKTSFVPPVCNKLM